VKEGVCKLCVCVRAIDTYILYVLQMKKRDEKNRPVPLICFDMYVSSTNLEIYKLEGRGREQLRITKGKAVNWCSSGGGSLICEYRNRNRGEKHNTLGAVQMVCAAYPV